MTICQPYLSLLSTDELQSLTKVLDSPLPQVSEKGHSRLSPAWFKDSDKVCPELS